MKQVQRKIFYICSLFIMLFSGSAARAEITNCTAIASVPYTITTAGIYCLTKDLKPQDNYYINAIDIQADNVTLDLNGYLLQGSRAACHPVKSAGIYADNRKNITIRNGTIRGFDSGINLYSDYSGTTESYLVENIFAESNCYSGIQVRGRGMVIRNNQVVNTVGAFNPHAISVSGPGNKITNNTVINTSGDGYAIGINVDGEGALLSGNKVHMVSSVTPDGGDGIWIMGKYSIVRDNTITSADRGIFFVNDVPGKYMGNLTDDIAIQAYLGGTPVGTND